MLPRMKTILATLSLLAVPCGVSAEDCPCGGASDSDKVEARTVAWAGPQSAKAAALSQAKPMVWQASEKSHAAELLAADADLRKDLAAMPKFERLKSGLPQVTVDDQTYWVAEGDLLLDEDQLLLLAADRQIQEQEFASRQRRQEKALAFTQQSGQGSWKLTGTVRGSSSGLVAVTSGGRLVRWGPSVVLRYCVLKRTFSPSDYQVVVENMIEATSGWEDTCGVDFQYMESLDTSNGVGVPVGAVFAVRGINAGGRFIASAFFPTDPPSRRKVLIDPSYFTTSFDRVGVLRHELGHVLGLRHEHIRSEAPAVCPNESTGFTHNLTNYDPQSVMHYFCGGAGSLDLNFSDLDRSGAQQMYGPPFDTLQFVEVE